MAESKFTRLLSPTMWLFGAGIAGGMIAAIAMNNSQTNGSVGDRPHRQSPVLTDYNNETLRFFGLMAQAREFDQKIVTVEGDIRCSVTACSMTNPRSLIIGPDQGSPDAWEVLVGQCGSDSCHVQVLISP